MYSIIEWIFRVIDIVIKNISKYILYNWCFYNRYKILNFGSYLIYEIVKNDKFLKNYIIINSVDVLIIMF